MKPHHFLQWRTVTIAGIHYSCVIYQKKNTNKYIIDNSYNSAWHGDSSVNCIGNSKACTMLWIYTYGVHENDKESQSPEKLSNQINSGG